MRIILLSDLHIKHTSKFESTSWAKNLCCFLQKAYHPETVIFVLGDIIDNDGVNAKLAFQAADDIFTHIESELRSVKFRIGFIPGNHDYCEGNLADFDSFSKKHQTIAKTSFHFSDRKTYQCCIEEFNFILTDSIQNHDYSFPGLLDIESICECVCPDKENVLLMHHSLIFEDSSDHTGIVDQGKTIDFLEKSGIQFVFHGHAHAERRFTTKRGINLIGVGSLGVENPDITNEKEQFLEIQANGRRIEAIVNWLWRGGECCYRYNRLYPEQHSEYAQVNLVPAITYEKPDNYIGRWVYPHDIAVQDKFVRVLSLDKRNTLLDICEKERLVLLIADAGMGKSVEMQNLAHDISDDNPYVRPVLLHLGLYNGESIIEFLNILAPQYKTLDPNQFVLIMDGYDELSDPICFKKAFARFVDMYPQVRVCVSMRSNFLPTNSSVFRKFSVYHLVELESDDIKT